MNEILISCIALILTLSKKPVLQEFELLAYEQACRIVETILKDTREVLDDRGLESYSR